MTVAEVKTNAAFKKWFGESQVVNNRGDPRVVYHGTDHSFTKFENRGGHVTILFSTFKVKRTGFFFAESETFAKTFIQERLGYVLPCYLSIQKPANFVDNENYEGMLDELDSIGVNRRWINTGEMWEKFDEDDGEKFVQQLTSLGYDGALIEEEDHKTKAMQRVWVAFKPSQIKSASKNDGTWDVNDPDIRSNPRRRR